MQYFGRSLGVARPPTLDVCFKGVQYAPFSKCSLQISTTVWLRCYSFLSCALFVQTDFFIKLQHNQIHYVHKKLLYSF